MRRAVVPFSGLLAVAVTFGALPAAWADDAGDFFEKKIRPLLAEQCFGCHGPKKVKASLRLDSREAILKGGESGTAMVVGDPAKSRLITAVGYKNPDLQMPPDNKKLPDEAIADLTAWVKNGAVWPGAGTQVAPGFDLAARRKAHWAWQPIAAHEPPAVRNAAWVKSPVDQFLLHRLEEKGIAPAGPAERRTLLRRVYFDLIGLPPTPTEVEDFLKDATPTALEKVVDRLLASDRFGERWGRHWLDLVRYAESRGHEFDFPIPNAYQYRDYIIRALNADVPYNQLVTEHLAGDLLDRPRKHPAQGFNESILGTGFWLLGEEVHSPVDIRQDQADRFDNRIDVMTKAFLGLTVSCARCHDHKFDAISAKDYYALFGFLESSGHRLVRFDTWETERRLAGELTTLRDRARPAVQQALAKAARPGVDQLGEVLLAAREVLKGEDAQVVADRRKLDVEQLRRWAAYLPNAAKDERDPLRAWARLSLDGPAGARALAEAGHKQADEAKAARDGVEVVVDYANSGPKEWLPDGVTFGSKPVRAGELRLPNLTFVERPAAERDAAWPNLPLSPGVENEPGALGGGGVHAGRTIRTPTFTIAGGKVFYLVRGSGRAYAAVGQHAMINGPLHGHLVINFKTGDRMQWVGHDLTTYKGLPTHIEFSFEEGADFALMAVVQADRPPSAVVPPNGQLLALLDGEVKPETLAAGYQKLFTTTLDRLADDHLTGETDLASLANWLVRHGDLFPGEVAKTTAEAAGPFLTEQAKLMAQVGPSRLAPALLDGNGFDERVFKRGSPYKFGDPAPRRGLEALDGPAPLVAPGSGRLELARRMTDPSVNPFISRVAANRIWHHLFGRGLVPSVDNFGVLGEAPTDRELLDYLADRFVRDGWSMKKAIRLLMLSNAYQMASRSSEEAEKADPENRLWHRAAIRRLEGEAIRDSMLAVSGRLDLTAFGPSVPVFLNEFQEGRGRPHPGPLDGNGRRSIYISVRRNFLSSMFLAFDTPIPFSTVGRRMVSNVPAQALMLMNDPFVQQQADLWAKRVAAGGGTPAERVAAMYLSAFGRPPSDAERDACLAFLERQAKLSDAKADSPGVWKDLAHVLFNAKEFIFID